MQYNTFLDKKRLEFKPVGFTPKRKINPKLFPFERDITLWAIRKGRAALFESCGLGKTPQQLEWARLVSHEEKAPVLIVAPLAVSRQTVQEGKKFDVPVTLCHDKNDVQQGVNITNYEKLHKFDSSVFCGVVLDESSILKSFSGSTRNEIIEMFGRTPYRLACTATPSPNDYMELGNHSEFLGVMTYTEMLSMFFINDTSDVGQWRLKKHAHEQEFWRWMCSWAVMISHPKDIGYVQDGFDLPPLEYVEHIIPAPNNCNSGFFVQEASTMDERREIRKQTIEPRCKKAAEIVNNSKDQWVIWCGLNDESRLLTKLINNAVEITGSQDPDVREKAIIGFSNGNVQRLVTKSTITGLGMNWQHCNKTIFVGLNDSWEQLYQSTRRLWRFGQNKPVEAHIVIEEREGKVLKNIKRKDTQAQHMIQSMVQHTSDLTKHELGKQNGDHKEQPCQQMMMPNFL